VFSFFEVLVFHLLLQSGTLANAFAGLAEMLRCWHSGPPSAATFAVSPVWSLAARRRDKKRLLARRAVLPVRPAHPPGRSRPGPRPRFPRTAPTLSCVLSQSIP